MNKKALMNAVVAVILTGGSVLVYSLSRGQRSVETPAPTETAVAAPENTVRTTSPVQKPAKSRQEFAPIIATAEAAPAPVSAWTRLSEKYGPEKTALAGKITSRITELINKGMDLANTAAKTAGSSSLAEAASKEILRNASRQLGLTEDQQKQAKEVIETAVNKRMAAVTDLTAAMASEPEQIMELVLAGDQLARKEITKEEYDRITGPTQVMLENVAGVVAIRRPDGGAPQYIPDPETLMQINAILTPDQQVKLVENIATANRDIAKAQQVARQTAQAAGFPFEPARIPAMDLERLDQTVTSMDQMAAAAQQMMAAMNNMRQANLQPGSSLQQLK